MKLKKFGTGQGYLKAGFLGFAKSGKSYTATLLAIELNRRIKSKKPVAYFDSEGGIEYIAPMIREATGKPPIGVKSRAFADLLDVAKECEGGAAAILIVDSVTHVWREVCKAYLLQVNKARQKMGRSKRSRLEFQDWAAIKEKWRQWTDYFLNSKLHIIICGRAGYEWDFQEREDSMGETHKELVKTGVKMKVETEFGFEPSLLVEMQRIQVEDARTERFRIIHRAIVLGDRFDVMDGQVKDNPTGDWFKPHLDMLVPGAENVVDTAVKTDMGVDERGDAEFVREKKEKAKLLEEIQGLIVENLPGQSAKEKKEKVAVLQECLGTRSWTAVEMMSLKSLKEGLQKVQKYFAPEATPSFKDDPDVQEAAREAVGAGKAKKSN